MIKRKINLRNSVEFQHKWCYTQEENENFLEKRQSEMLLLKVKLEREQRHNEILQCGIKQCEDDQGWYALIKFKE